MRDEDIQDLVASRMKGAMSLWPKSSIKTSGGTFDIEYEKETRWSVTIKVSAPDGPRRFIIVIAQDH